MFVFQFMGGLGNQLFQYAAAKALSVKRGIPFRIDFDDPYKFVKRQFNLFPFNVQVEQASWVELYKCKPKRRIEKRLWILAGKDPACRLYQEKNSYTYDPDFFSCPDGAYISGFWQTEKYFLDIEDSIRSEFEIKIPPSPKNLEWLKMIKSCSAVSVHIRRGDYVNVPKTNLVHGICDKSYYERAFKLIAEMVNDPVFFFFSDDIEWVKENINTTYPAHYVDANGDAHNYEDLRLMSSCRHHIIANSSFSWWGAWLNQDKQKKVIGPAKWINTCNIADTDHIPASWILL